MRKNKSLPCRTITLCMTLLMALTSTHAQLRQRHVTGVNISPQISNYLEFLPAGYNLPANATKTYPLIIYWKGLFDFDIPGTVAKGIPQKIESYAFPETVTYNGVQYSFMALTPMYLNDGCNATDVDAFINYAVLNYRVDPNRIYMTGISKGGSLCYQYINAGLAYAKKIAAIAPLAPCASLSWTGGGYVVQEKIRVWGIHNPIDQVCNVGSTTGSIYNVNAQNPNPPQLAAYTLTPTNWTPDTHDIFWIPYEPGYSAPESGGKNMYDWFIQFSKTSSPPPPPPTNTPPVANAGADQSIQLPTNSATLNGGASSDANGTITAYAWTKIAGPATFNLSNANSVSASVTNLVEGTYSFRLLVTDNNGATDDDTMRVVVAPAAPPPPPPPPGGTPNCSTITVTPGSSNIKLKGLIAPVVAVHIFNSSWATAFNQVFTNSPDSINVSSLSAGTYFVKVNFYTAGWAHICEKSQNAVVAAGPPPPPPPPPPGTPNCSTIVVTPEAGALKLKGLIAPVVAVHIFNGSWATAYNEVFTNSPDNVTVPLPVGTYHVKTTFYTSGWSFICDQMSDASISTPTVAAGPETERTVAHETVTERIGIPAARYMTVAPNPVVTSIRLTVGSVKNEMATIVITDMAGRQVHRRAISLQQGVNRLSLDCSSYKAGSYYLRLITADGVENLRLIKQ